ncbi:MAG: uroporphyrinogen-III synthase [Chloroflexi bacterium]|nr:uroporphyrinogen-III synthase [Chloroflexota bacterium]
MSDLQGRTVAILEARRSEELAGLIERHGGRAYRAPAMREVPLANTEDVSAFLERLASGSLAAMIFLTGVGCRALLEAAAERAILTEVLAALEHTQVAARGPKPLAVLRQYGVRVDLVPPEPNTTRELLEGLAAWPLAGQTVGVQLYGAPNSELRSGLEALGAHVEEIALYRWDFAADAGPVLRLLAELRSGGIDVLAVTSQNQVRNLFALAEACGQEEALREALNGPVLVAAVGPVCRGAFVDRGVKVDIEPEHPKMGHLVLAIGAHLVRLFGAPDASPTMDTSEWAAPREAPVSALSPGLPG